MVQVRGVGGNSMDECKASATESGPLLGTWCLLNSLKQVGSSSIQKQAAVGRREEKRKKVISRKWMGSGVRRSNGDEICCREAARGSRVLLATGKRES
jgi:hypothetical protein